MREKAGAFVVAILVSCAAFGGESKQGGKKAPGIVAGQVFKEEIMDIPDGIPKRPC